MRFLLIVLLLLPLTSYVAHADDGTAQTDATSPQDSTSLEKSGIDTSLEDKYQSLSELFELYQPYLGNIGPHEPIYFLFGAEPEESKFQISLKYRFFNAEGTWSKAHPWLQGFHFGYTQTSFWDLKSVSKPFEDTSYKPELFFLSSNVKKINLRKGRFFIQSGLQHESNGRGGLDSRAADSFYIKPILIYYQSKSQLGLSVAPKLSAYLTDESGNLKDYRGFFDLEIKFGHAESIVVATHLSWAKEGGSCQLDMTYPLDRIFDNNLNLYLQLQYTNALAETLINYHQRTDALRLGFAFIR